MGGPADAGDGVLVAVAVPVALPDPKGCRNNRAPRLLLAS